MNRFIILASALVLTSCVRKHEGEKKTSFLSNFLSITNNENNGVKNILHYYGGYCEYSIGKSYSADKGNSNFFELNLSKSAYLDKFSKMPELPASNMSYIFFKNLKNEKNHYTELHSVLQFKARDKFEAKYTLEQLTIVEEKLTIVNSIVDILKSKKFERLKPFLNEESYPDSIQKKLFSGLHSVDPRFGNIDGFKLSGFIFSSYENFEVLKIFGILLRDKENNQITINIDLKEGENKIHYLDYTW